MAELQRNSARENLQTRKRPIIIVLDNVRSGQNVGSILRTADAMGVKKVYMGGITPYPPDRQVLKTALGAESSVKWEHKADCRALLESLKPESSIYLVEQTLHSVTLGAAELKTSKKQVVLVFGNEVKGVSDELLTYGDKCLEIPQHGHKHSLNVAISAGIVLWEMCRLSED